MRIAWRLFEGLRIHNAGDAAPAMAFHFFLSLVPLLVLVGFVLGHVARQRGVDALLGPAIETAPDAVEQLVRVELERMAGTRASSVAPLSVLGFLWLAATGTHGLMDAFEVAAGASRRPWWKKRIISLAWVASTLMLLGILGWGMIRIDLALPTVDDDAAVDAPSTSPSASGAALRAPAPSASASSHRSSPGSGVAGGKGEHASRETREGIVKRARHRLAPLFHETWERLAVGFVFTLAALAALAAFYRVAVEHPRRVERRAWPGALVAFTSWLAVSWGFGEYVVASLDRYALFYGSVATVAVLLVWLYLTSWALLVGAELNAQLEGLRDSRAASR
jgi:membrane protein